MVGSFPVVQGKPLCFCSSDDITISLRALCCRICSNECATFSIFCLQRPWHEIEGNFAIIFKVGMGGTPAIPDRLSKEGKDFLEHCLENDPKLRWTASQLQDHPFTKVLFVPELLPFLHSIHTKSEWNYAKYHLEGDLSIAAVFHEGKQHTRYQMFLEG